MADISADLQARLAANPADSFDLIVRTHGSASPHLNWLAAQGFQVKREFKLVPGVAITCTGAQALTLLEQDWVLSVELDEIVHTT